MIECCVGVCVPKDDDDTDLELSEHCVLRVLVDARLVLDVLRTIGISVARECEVWWSGGG